LGWVAVEGGGGKKEKNGRNAWTKNDTTTFPLSTQGPIVEPSGPKGVGVGGKKRKGATSMFQNRGGPTERRV